MDTTKTAILTFRPDLGAKAAPCAATALIMDYCDRNDIHLDMDSMPDYRGMAK